MTENGEAVVLLSETGEAVGTALKAEVHTTDTPLHLAFSCHLSDGEGRLLVTRRALTKKAWPGVWTNSFCGHPAPGEDIEQAVHRRARDELGARIGSIEIVLPDFRYRAVDASGVVENEICPVYRATLEGDLHPNPDEVMDWHWVDEAEFTDVVARSTFAFSPWLVLQLPELAARRV